MPERKTETTVFFADIVGSTRLYEQLGDVAAQRAISDCFDEMSQLVGMHGGSVIKTIGDEIMCRFPRPDDAAQSAQSIQEAFQSSPIGASASITVRIGFHFGSVIVDDNDVFGDAVNVAARMASIARPEQIITTEDTVGKLTPELQGNTRRFDRVQVKGKREPITIYEVLWTRENLTQMLSMNFPTFMGEAEEVLHVSCGNTEKKLTIHAPSFMIGRNRECDLVVNSPGASRMHARIECRRGKFILLDTSTNGTYVRTSTGRDIYLRREELPLMGETTVSLGERIDPESPDLVRIWF